MILMASFNNFRIRISFINNPLGLNLFIFLLGISLIAGFYIFYAVKWTSKNYLLGTFSLGVSLSASGCLMALALDLYTAGSRVLNFNIWGEGLLEVLILVFSILAIFYFIQKASE